jgi:hypothetical protein
MPWRLPHLFDSQPDLLHSLVTILSPAVLREEVGQHNMVIRPNSSHAIWSPDLTGLHAIWSPDLTGLHSIWSDVARKVRCCHPI